MENKLEKVLVCVEDVNLDKHVIEYTHMIAKAANIKTVHLLHVIHDIPSEEYMARSSQIDGLDAELDKHYQEETRRLTVGYNFAMETAAEKHFTRMDGIEHHVHVIVGNQLRDTLKFAHKKDIDLIVMGRHLGARLERGDAALLPRRITRKATCSVLTIPENFTPTLSRIMVPVRNSKCSVRALQTAIDLGEAFEADVLAMNLFHIYRDPHYPGGAPDTIIPIEKKMAYAQKHATQECDSLRDKVTTNNGKLEFQCRLDEKFLPAELCNEIVAETSSDLVVIGARGRTGAAGVLLGTVTEQLIEKCHVPLLATKKKGEHIGIFKALLSLFE